MWFIILPSFFVFCYMAWVLLLEALCWVMYLSSSNFEDWHFSFCYSNDSPVAFNNMLKSLLDLSTSSNIFWHPAVKKMRKLARLPLALHAFLPFRIRSPPPLYSITTISLLLLGTYHSMRLSYLFIHLLVCSSTPPGDYKILEAKGIVCFWVTWKRWYKYRIRARIMRWPDPTLSSQVKKPSPRG